MATPLVLAIDTCLHQCSVAVAQGATLLAMRSDDIGVGHAEHLAPMAAEVLAEAGAAPRDLTHIAATVGPGSFMGARVGISFAKGMAFAVGAKGIGLTTLEALWLSAGEGEAHGAVAIDARRGQVYAEAFGDKIASGPQLLDLDDASAWLEALPPGGARLGSGMAVLRPDADWTDTRQAPDIAAMALWAANASEGRALTPLYLRAPDAKPMRRPG